MLTLRIRHRTTYLYHAPVRLGPHRLMLRPRESRELRLVSHEVTVTPAATVTWAHDVFGNAVATAGFEGLTDRLVVDSEAVLTLGVDPWPVFDIAAVATRYPFAYTDADWTDLGALVVPQYLDPDRRLLAWAKGFVRSDPTDTLSLLKDISAGVAQQIRYQSRESEGTQAPLETLARGLGSCRDLAVLFVEAARCLRFGARLCSGYLFRPDRATGNYEADSTHAWAEVYLPGAGWITFDPTHNRIGAAGLIPLAVGRTNGQIMPVAGSYGGSATDALGMVVSVRIAPVMSAP